MSEESWLEAYQFHGQPWESYRELRDAFEWEIPDRFNIAQWVCDRWAEDYNRLMLIGADDEGFEDRFSFHEVNEVATRLATALDDRGVETGDRIGVNCPQRVETAVSYLAAWKLGAVPVPLSTKFGPDAIQYRLHDSGAKACVVEGENLSAYRAVQDRLGELTTTITIDGGVRDEELDFWKVVDETLPRVQTVETDADAPAILLYTSGTTGDPKGVLHAHRFFLGHLPLFLTTFCNLSLDENDVFWMPSEWTWIAVFNIVFPAWFYGLPAVAYRSDRFSPDEAFDVIDRYAVTKTFIPPTALRMMKSVDRPAERFETDHVSVIASGGEALDRDTFEWASDVFGEVAVHEAYGQTEANMLIGHCTALREHKNESMGFEGLGHEIELLDPELATPLSAPDTIGEIGVRIAGDPVCFLEYWNEPEKTDSKVKNGFLLTEDLATRDEDGYFTFVSRKDDVIISAGYRIGPKEIEETLNEHEAVASAGVIGIPHEQRGEVPKAFVETATNHEPSEELRIELQQFVKSRLAAYQYPREIAFIDELPRTTTGKIRRESLPQENTAHNS